MEVYQGLFYQTTLAMASGVSTSVVAWATDPKNRGKFLRLAWVGSVVVLIVGTATSLGLSYIAADTLRWGVYLSSVMYGLFFGVVILFFLSGKAVSATIGGLLGISVDQIGTGNSIVLEAGNTIRKLAEEIGSVAGSDTRFITQSVWLFVIVLTLTCLPAFFRRSSVLDVESSEGGEG